MCKGCLRLGTGDKEKRVGRYRLGLFEEVISELRQEASQVKF